jgi:hypothetical protein
MGILRIQGAEKITVNGELNPRDSVYCSPAIKMKKAPCAAFFVLVAWGGMCRSRLKAIPPSLRDRAMRVQGHAPGMSLVKPKVLRSLPSRDQK